MALMISFLVIFALILAVFNYKNKYSMLWAVMSLAIALCAVTLSVEIQRVSNYNMAGNYFFSAVDAKLFFKLNEFMPLSLSMLQVIRNISYGVFQTGNLAFFYLFDKYTKHSVKPGRQGSKRFVAGMMVAMTLGYIIFYHPDIGYRIFLAQFEATSVKAKLFLTMAGGMHWILMIFTYLGPLLPILYLLLNYRKQYLTIFFQQLFSRILILLALDILFFTVIAEPFQVKWEELLRTGFWRGISTRLIPRYNISALALISFCLLLLISYLLIRFQTANLIDYFKEYSIKKHLHNLHDNLRDVLHSEKNVLFNYKILAESVLSEYGTQQGRQKLERLVDLSNSHLESLTTSINNIKDFRINTIKRKFTEAIEAALQVYPLPAEIKLLKNYDCDEVLCNYDLYHMTQIIINLLENSVDSLAGRSDGVIELNLEASEYWVLFSVCDNGSGIPPKIIRKIHKPYFSTKSKQNNWGIGLFYVQKVVKAHLGYMRIRSQLKAGTKVELLFMCDS